MSQDTTYDRPTFAEDIFCVPSSKVITITATSIFSALFSTPFGVSQHDNGVKYVLFSRIGNPNNDENEGHKIMWSDIE